jgi:hypothetical protein
MGTDHTLTQDLADGLVAVPSAHYQGRQVTLLPRTLSGICHAALEWAHQFMEVSASLHFAQASAKLGAACTATPDYMIAIDDDTRDRIFEALHHWLPAIHLTRTYLAVGMPSDAVDTGDDCGDIRATVRALLTGNHQAVAEQIAHAQQPRVLN